MIKRRQEESWSVVMLGILFILATLFFHWRESKQEMVIIEIKEMVDKIYQRVEKIEKETVVVEVEQGTADLPKPQRVKIKPKIKKSSMSLAGGLESEPK